MNKILVKKVENRKQLRQFINLEWQINKNDPHWVPHLLIDRLKILDKNKNPFYQHAESEFFLAYKNDQVSGRIAAITNSRHNEFHQDNIGFFGFLEGIDDPDVFRALLDTAQDWIKHKGKDAIIGPMNPSTNDEIGFLIDGFDSPPFFMMTHNPPYYKRLMEQLKYEKIKDVYAYYADRNTIIISDKLKRIVKTTQSKLNIKLRTVNLANFNDELARIRKIYNNAWARNWGFVPMTPAEFDFIANDFKKILDPNLVLIAEIDNEPIGFSLALPNYNEVFNKIPDGKLFPVGWLKFLLNRKKIKTIRVITLGVIDKYQQSGIGGIFYLETFERGIAAGYNAAEFSWVLEDNELMNRAVKLLGGELYKTYRIYGKHI
jgi:hypothetical protein